MLPKDKDKVTNWVLVLVLMCSKGENLHFLLHIRYTLPRAKALLSQTHQKMSHTVSCHGLLRIICHNSSSTHGLLCTKIIITRYCFLYWKKFSLRLPHPPQWKEYLITVLCWCAQTEQEQVTNLFVLQQQTVDRCGVFCDFRIHLVDWNLSCFKHLKNCS